ncbi:unnamed protein product [Adineta steineri]|uniref:Uncharacterized protein n=1 Tax=Adineta steineri TaxID=433720 RepID=A0A814AMP4_9BILA|nr:unnamed protein product [Adineta steineri]CAF3574142.1 unnamed protein product [Adineta steineri]
MSADEHVSYVPNGRGGRFVRYSYARPSSTSNRFVELGRFFYNLTRGIFQLMHVLHYSLTTFNNMISSLPFCIRYIVQLILTICFPFYSLYQGYILLINRIHRIAYPFYRVITLVTRLFTFFVTLPIRILTYVFTQTQVFLQNLLKFSIVVAIIIGLIALFLEENQLNYIKSYVQNTTDSIFKQSSIV